MITKTKTTLISKRGPVATTKQDKPKTTATFACKVPADEIVYWKRYKKSKDTDARNFLMERYLPTVRYVAERLIAKLPQSVELDDLTSAGIFGLMQAIDGFDLEREVKFETYCVNRIRGAILDELRNLDWVPRLVRTKGHKLSNAYRELEIDLGKAPTDEQMSRKLGLSSKEYDEMVREASAITVVSLSEKMHNDDDDNDLTKMQMVKNTKGKSPSEDIQRRELVEHLTRGLSRKEKLILVLYYYEELTMREIGAIIDLSESRVCQIHSKIIMRLQHQLRSIRREMAS